MTTRILTLQTLIDKGACEGQRAEFERRFGTSVRVTQRLCRSVAHVFSWNWAALHLLTAPAWQAYDAATMQALQAYDAATAQARQALDAATAQASQAYDAATAQARQAYKEATAQAWQAFNAATAQAFARAYNSKENAQ